MKVLFVSREKKINRIHPIVFNQGESLKKNGVDITYYTIRGRGIFGYLKSIPLLRNEIKRKETDIIHSHFSLSGIVSVFAGSVPVCTSLMGSDLKRSNFFKLPIQWISKYLWDFVIVKSLDMKNALGLKENIEVVPNGVDTERFAPMCKSDCLKKLGWNSERKHIFFAANPKRPEKNYSLFEQSVSLLKDDYPEIKVHFLENIPNEIMPVYLNAADVICLSSLWEGSPNVIKEAISCNRPVVSTDVGNVKRLFGDLKGHFLSENSSPEHYSEKLKMAIDFSEHKGNTNGRSRIYELELDSDSVAKRIIKIYKKILSGK